MARVRGSLFELSGSIGPYQFVKNRYGQFLRTKSGVSPQRVLTDPAFERTRQNAKTFRKAMKATALLRSAMLPILEYSTDPGHSNRITKAMMRILKMDRAAEAGEEHFRPEHLELLTDFSFNQQCSFDFGLRCDLNVVVDQSAGSVSVNLPSVRPGRDFEIEKGVSHVRVDLVGAFVDFNRLYETHEFMAGDFWDVLDHEIPSKRVSFKLPNLAEGVFVIGVNFRKYAKEGRFIELRRNRRLNASKVLEVLGNATVSDRM